MLRALVAAWATASLALAGELAVGTYLSILSFMGMEVSLSKLDEYLLVLGFSWFAAL